MFLNEDYLTKWVDKNNGLCITRNINNLNTFNFNTQHNFPVILTGYDNIIKYFFDNIIQHIKSKIVLIFIESDVINIPLKYIENPNILHIFTWNKQIEHVKISAIPIGLNFKRQYKSIIEWLSNKNKNKVMSHNGNENGNGIETEIITNIVCYNCSLNTSPERKILQNVILNKMKDFCKELDYIPFLESKIVPSNIEGQLKVDITNPKCYDEWLKYKFILSPEGAGLDCHRTWEAVIVGIIPIVKSSSINEVYQDLPILVVNEWSDLSVDLLKEQHRIITSNIQNHKYNLDKVNLSYWTDKILYFINYNSKNIITTYSNFINNSIYYSQCQEDLFLNNHIFKNKQNGKYIELGALDGVLYSNTKFFEDSLNWSGILIEPHPDKFKLLKQSRPNNYLFNDLISCYTEPLKFRYFVDGHAAVSGVENTLPQSHFDTFFESNNEHNKSLPQNSIFITPKTLSDIIKSTNIKHFDLLSLDVEGHEYEVLQSWDFSIPIDVILIETLGVEPEKDELCRQFLLKNNYKFITKFKHNEIFFSYNYSLLYNSNY